MCYTDASVCATLKCYFFFGKVSCVKFNKYLLSNTECSLYILLKTFMKYTHLKYSNSISNLKKQRMKITQLEKVSFIKVNQLKLTQFELFQFFHFMCDAVNTSDLFFSWLIQEILSAFYTILAFHFKYQVLYACKLTSLS